MAAVAERLRLGMSAAAEPGLGAAPDRVPACRADLERAHDMQRAVLCRRHLEWAVLDGERLDLAAFRLARRLEAGLAVHAVAIGLVERLAATAERGAMARRIAGDAQLRLDRERAVLPHPDRIDAWRGFFVAARFAAPAQRARRTFGDHRDGGFRRRGIGIDPRPVDI